MNKNEVISVLNSLRLVLGKNNPADSRVIRALEIAIKAITAQPDILDDEEKKYLGQVIRPYHNRIINITKRENQGESYIRIALKHFKNTSVDDICLPCFSAESGMYKGMKPNTKYTLDELGL